MKSDLTKTQTKNSSLHLRNLSHDPRMHEFVGSLSFSKHQVKWAYDQVLVKNHVTIVRIDTDYSQEIAF